MPMLTHCRDFQLLLLYAMKCLWLMTPSPRLASLPLWPSPCATPQLKLNQCLQSLVHVLPH